MRMPVRWWLWARGLLQPQAAASSGRARHHAAAFCNVLGVTSGQTWTRYSIGSCGARRDAWMTVRCAHMDILKSEERVKKAVADQRRPFERGAVPSGALAVLASARQ